MNGWTKWLVAMALAVTLAAAGAARLAVAQAPAQTPPATRIAVVNMVDLFDRLDAKKDADNAMQKLSDDLQKELDSRKEKVKNLSDQLQGYKEGSDIYNQTQNQAMMQAMDLQAFQQYYMPNKLNLEKRLRTAALYSQINQAIADYARTHGIALVLVADPADLSTARTSDELLSKITIRKVIYADPSLDITQQIVEKMNADYKLGGGSAK